MRNTPGGLAFVERAATAGVRAATTERDAQFDDYSAAGDDRRPDPGHVVIP